MLRLAYLVRCAGFYVGMVIIIIIYNIGSSRQQSLVCDLLIHNQG